MNLKIIELESELLLPKGIQDGTGKTLEKITKLVLTGKFLPLERQVIPKEYFLLQEGTKVLVRIPRQKPIPFGYIGIFNPTITRTYSDDENFLRPCKTSQPYQFTDFVVYVLI